MSSIKKINQLISMSTQVEIKAHFVAILEPC